MKNVEEILYKAVANCKILGNKRLQAKNHTGGLYMVFKVRIWRKLTKNQKIQLLKQKAHL